ncbi:MFS transporter [Sphingobium chungbukense]|nr:MFS transporter [Sphingobium chungbukense]
MPMVLWPLWNIICDLRRNWLFSRSISAASNCKNKYLFIQKSVYLSKQVGGEGNAMDGRNPSGWLEDRPLSRHQMVNILIVILLSVLDGYDVLAISFAMPALSTEWAIGKAAVGLLLASGLVGMAFGSFILAPLADLYGRRRLVIANLVTMIIGTGLSSACRTVEELAFCRVLTGLGIGGMVAVIIPLASELANRRRRTLVLAIVAMGFPIGGMLGGLASAILLRNHGWPAVFLAGAGVALIILPAVILFLSESLSYLAGSQPPDQRLVRVNALLQRFNCPPVADIPAPAPARRGYALLFAPNQRQQVVQMSVVNLCLVMVAYYFSTWLPQMIADTGFSPVEASLVSSASNMAGIAGGVSLGIGARRLGLRPIAIVAMLGVALSVGALGLSPASPYALFGAAALCGYFVFASGAGIYAILGTVFVPEARATSSGFVIGVGRIGSAIAPAMAGWMFAAGLGRAEVSAVFSVIALSGTLVLILGRRLFQPTS